MKNLTLDNPDSQSREREMRSIKESKIVNLFEGSAFQLISQSSKGSAFQASINRITKEEKPVNKTVRDSLMKFREVQDERIYLKRHLLKTRGISSLTRSFNNETSTVINIMNRIEEKRNSKIEKKLEKVNLAKIIQDTSKGFKVALYDLCKATHDMKPKLLPANMYTDVEVIDSIPTL
jgi:hypothetical protein